MSDNDPDPRIVGLFQQAHDFYAAHNLLQAAAVYTSALSVNPDFVPALVQRALVLIELDQTGKAADDIEHALRLDPDFGLAYYGRAWLHSLQGDYDDEMLDALIGLDRDPENAHLYYRRIGSAHHHLRRFDEAITAYDYSLELNPEQPGTYYNRGICRMEMSDYRAALDDFNTALDNDPNWSWALHWRGRAHTMLDQYDQALIDLTRAVTFDHMDDMALLWRGEVHFKLGLVDKARADFEAVLTLARNATRCQHAREYLREITIV